MGRNDRDESSVTDKLTYLLIGGGGTGTGNTGEGNS